MVYTTLGSRDIKSDTSVSELIIPTRRGGLSASDSYYIALS